MIDCGGCRSSRLLDSNIFDIALDIHTVDAVSAAVEVGVPLHGCPHLGSVLHRLVRLYEVGIDEDVVGQAVVHVAAIIHLLVGRDSEQLRGILNEVGVARGTVATREVGRLIVVPRHTISDDEVYLALQAILGFFIIVCHDDVGLSRIKGRDGLLGRLGILFQFQERLVGSAIWRIHQIVHAQGLLRGTVVGDGYQLRDRRHLPGAEVGV